METGYRIKVSSIRDQNCDLWLTNISVTEASEVYFGIRSALNPYLTNGISHHYQLEESTFILGALGVIFNFYPNFRRIFV